MQSPDSFDAISNIVFDLDGTLVDSAQSILECFRLTLAAKNYPLGVLMDQSLVGPPLRETMKFLSNERNPLKLDALVTEFKSQYDSGVCNLAAPYPGAEELLSNLKKSNKKIFIVTNKRHNPTIQIISNFGWSNLIDDIYTIDYPSIDFKNKALVIRQLLSDYSLEKAKSCYVGDRIDDYAAASENGLKFIHALWGYGANDFSIPCTYAASSANRLNALLIQ